MELNLKYVQYKVQLDESLTTISGYSQRVYDTIQRINNFKEDIYPGDVITIPKSCIKFTRGNSVEYKLQNYDSFISLANYDGIFYKLIVDWNGTNKNYIGSTIFIPKELKPVNDSYCLCMII